VTAADSGGLRAGTADTDRAVAALRAVAVFGAAVFGAAVVFWAVARGVGR
jgi:hypothetical protein